MNRTYRLIITLENGEEAINATSTTGDDIFNYLRIGNAKADIIENELLENYSQPVFREEL